MFIGGLTTALKDNEADVIVGMLSANLGSTTHLAGWHLPRLWTRVRNSCRHQPG